MKEATLEQRVIQAADAVTKAINDSFPFNDFGSVLGAQDEAGDIYATFLADIGRAATRARRLSNRIRNWNAGNRNVTML